MGGDGRRKHSKDVPAAISPNTMVHILYEHRNANID